YGLTRAADLAIHRQPTLIADGARGRQFSAHQLREFRRQRDIFRRFDPAPYSNQNRCLRQVNRLFCFPEKLKRSSANLLLLQINLDRRDRSGRRTARHLIAAKRSGLKGNEPGRSALKRYVRSCFTLEHLTYKY